MFAGRRQYPAAGAIAAAALMAMSVATSAGAQELRLGSHSSPVSVSPGIPTVEDARRLYDEGRWKEARKAYDEIADRAIKDGEYAPKAFEGRAQMQYISDDVRGAAKTFAELAAQASKYGDPETELTANFRAALLYQEVRDYRNAAMHVPRIKALLKSPVISDTTRASVAKRVA